MDDRRHGSDEAAAAAVVVSSVDADEEDRRAARSLIIALLLALLVAAAVLSTDASGITDSTSTGSNGSADSAGSTGSAAGGGAPSGPCSISDEVAAALSTARTPWDYMRMLGYPKSTIGDVLNERAESVMDEYANGQVRWDPSANDGVYPDDAQLVLIMDEGGQSVEITDTQQVMAMLSMEPVCPPGTDEVVLPAVS